MPPVRPGGRSIAAPRAGAGAGERPIASTADNETADFLPDFCARWNLLLVILIAELLAIVLAVAQPGPWVDRLRYLAIASLFIQWVALTDAALLCSARGLLHSLGGRLAAIVLFLVLQGVTLAFTLFAWWLTEITALALALPEGWLLERVISNGLISATVTAVALRYFYVQHQWKLNVQAEARSRIGELQARIRPHFLFNSMNTIASLARTDPVKTEQAVEDLAEVFRATLTTRDQLTLAEELELARSYLRIEALRLGERLRVDWRLEVDPEALVLPALTLQPLVENAVYHGIEGLPDGGLITISARLQGRIVTIEITNPVPSSGRRSGGNRIALANIRQRLQLMFAGHEPLETVEADGVFTVRLRLPAERARRREVPAPRPGGEQPA